MSPKGQCKYVCMCVCVRACVRASPNGETIYMLPFDECKNIGYIYIYIYIYIYVYITYCVIVIRFVCPWDHKLHSLKYISTTPLYD